MRKKSGITGKVIFIGLVTGLLLIANACIGGKLKDRENAKNFAVKQISEAAGGRFSLKEIYVSIPYTYIHTYRDASGVLLQEKIEDAKTFPASAIAYDASLSTQMRTIGIYSAPIYTGNIKIDCVFDVDIPENKDGYEYFPEKASVRLAIKEKSIMNRPVFVINDARTDVSFSKGFSDNLRQSKELAAQTDVSFSKSSPGNQSELTSSFVCRDGKNSFSTTLEIRGAESFQVMLASTQAKLSVKSDWQSPGFSNYDYLPDIHEITDTGFTASWNLPFSSIDEKNYIGFDYVQPVEIYKMLHRTIGYGFLFIIVPFIILFLFDVFLRTNFHPFHYLLSGAASVIFFLLLLSFSEHISFSAAYIISAAASGLLVSMYVASITRRFFLGCSMGGAFVVLYCYLFFSLKSEDYALLIGSLFAFTILASVMFITRKVDWNSLGLPNKSKDSDNSVLPADSKSGLIEQ